MGERRRRTLGERGAEPDPIIDIRYGPPDSPPARDVAGEWLENAGGPKWCSCGIELPVTGKCGYCD